MSYTPSIRSFHITKLDNIQKDSISPFQNPTSQSQNDFVSSRIAHSILNLSAESDNEIESSLESVEESSSEPEFINVNEVDLSDELWEEIEGAKPPVLVVMKQVRNLYVSI